MFLRDRISEMTEGRRDQNDVSQVKTSGLVQLLLKDNLSHYFEGPRRRERVLRKNLTVQEAQM